MRTTDSIAVPAEVEHLVTKRAGLREDPPDLDAWASASVAIRNAIDDLADELEALDETIAAHQQRIGLVTKRCELASCGRWMRVAATGRARAFCDDACRAAAYRARRAS